MSAHRLLRHGCLAALAAILCLLLVDVAAGRSGSDDSGDLAARIEQAREIGYTRHWREAQVLLDELAPEIDGAGQRAFVEFHLLEARHLSLDDRSLEAIERAAMLLELPLDDDQHLRVQQFGANVSVLLRDYESAFEYLIAALEIEPDVDDPVATIATYNMAAYMFGRVGEYQRASEYGQMAIERALEHADTNDECVARQRVAPVYKWAGEDERAEAEYRQAIAVCQSVGNQLFSGVVRHGLADLLRGKGRLDEADELARQAIADLEVSGYPLGEHEARLVLAETRFDRGELGTEARGELAELMAYFDTRMLWDQAARLAELQTRLAIQAGDASDALAHFDRQIEARELFLSRDRTMRLAFLEVSFDTRMKEQRIAFLEESARAARLEAIAAHEQQRARTIILALSAALLVLLTVLLVGAFRGRHHFRQLSRFDHLSGLANQRWFTERAQAMLSQAERDHRPAFLVMGDIDHFKAVNDEHGHLTGDTVLEQTARRLRAAFGEDALIGRVGGEEFAVLKVSDGIEAVIEGIERFRQGRRKAVRRDDPEVSLSFGIARHQTGEDLTGLRRRADLAMYRAKRAGRDCYRIFEDDPEPDPAID